MFLDNLKIGVRLALGFLVILALTLVVGAVSIDRLGAVNEATADIATNWLPATRHLGAVKAALNAERRAEAMIAVARSADTLAAEAKSLDTAKGQAVAAWEAYLHTVTTPEERVLTDAANRATEAYREAQGRTLALARGTEEGAAFALYTGENREKFKAMLAAVDQCIDFQAKGSDAAYKSSQDHFASTRLLVIALLVAAVGIGALLGWRLTRAITLPIGQAVQLAETVAAGDLSSRLEVTRRDEIGQLLSALMRMNGSLARIVGDVRKSSDSIATGSTQIASGNADLSQRTEEQASNLQQTAASMEELTVTVRNNADAAQQARQIAGVAQDAADQGGAVVGRVVETMQQISDSSKRIGDIIGVIDGIAFQTNILALNAAVEAARAGEQGRGLPSSPARCARSRSAAPGRPARSRA